MALEDGFSQVTARVLFCFKEQGTIRAEFRRMLIQRCRIFLILAAIGAFLLHRQADLLQLAYCP